MNGNKWADFIITEVRQHNGSITFLKVRIDKGQNLEEYGILSKNDIIKHLKDKKKIITAYKRVGYDQFIYGSEVVLYQDINNKDQIRTESNHTSPDNLDRLPRF